MSRKGKDVIFDSRFMFKHQALLQDYHNLEKEDNVMRSKLEAAKQKKRVLAAEVRFLRKRYKYLMEAKGMNISSEEKRQVQPLKSEKQFKTMNQQHLISRNAATRHPLPPLPVQKHSTKSHYVANLVPTFAIPGPTDQHLTKLLHGKQTIINGSSSVSVLGHNGRMHVGNDTIARNAFMGFDLNQGSGSSLFTRAPVFDLNEISTGDDNLQNSLEAVNIEEAKSLRRGLNEEQQQNDLTLPVCRNSDEGSSRAGKRKISWQDPLALRV